MGGSKGILKARFAVGRAGGARASVWRVWSRGNDVYATTTDAMAGVSKYSFHASGVCAYAIVAERWTKVDVDRARLKWRRMDTPPLGSQTAAPVLKMVFPTDHLSTALALPKKPVHWIDPPPSGSATGIDMIFTREPRERMRQLLGETRPLVAYYTLPSGEAFAIVCSHSPGDNPAVRMPASHGQKERVFPRVDRFNTGRPERLTLHLHSPADGDHLVAWELGGHAVSSDTDFREPNELILTRSQTPWTQADLD